MEEEARQLAKLLIKGQEKPVAKPPSEPQIRTAAGLVANLV